MMDGMNDESQPETLETLLIDASTVAEHAETLRESAEDHASVLPDDFIVNLGVLVEELRDLRDGIHDLRIDPSDDTALPRRQRPTTIVLRHG
jgi:hypothetical protein